MGFGPLDCFIVLPIFFVLGLLGFLLGWVLDRAHDRKMRQDAIKYMDKEEARLYLLSDRELINLARKEIKK